MTDNKHKQATLVSHNVDENVLQSCSTLVHHSHHDYWITGFPWLMAVWRRGKESRRGGEERNELTTTGSTHTLTYTTYTVKALITFMQTSNINMLFMVNGRNLSWILQDTRCHTQSLHCKHCWPSRRVQKTLSYRWWFCSQLRWSCESETQILNQKSCLIMSPINVFTPLF